jgi:ABC-2 type transport system ATP-binding protein
MSIQVQQLTKTYSTQKAIDNISFNIAKGEIVGFLPMVQEKVLQ